MNTQEPKLKTSVFDAVEYDQKFIPDDKRTLDADAKKILKYRAVLAHILKYAVPDFRYDDVDDLADRIAKDPGNSDYAQIVDIENEHSGMVSIKFDLRTSVITGAGCEVIVNIEPQNRYRPSIKNGQGAYSLAQRGMYYISRLISSQLGVNDLSYNTLKKCYSIWLIFDKNIKEPQVLDYKMTEQSGQQTAISRRYDREIDLAELIFITMDRQNTRQEDIFKFLNALFVDSTGLSEFIPLNEETQSIHKEVRDMCNISDWRYEIGVEEGREEGKEEGREDLILAYLKHSVTLEMTAEDIVSLLCNSFGLPREEAQRYYEKYSSISR